MTLIIIDTQSGSRTISLTADEMYDRKQKNRDDFFVALENANFAQDDFIKQADRWWGPRGLAA